MAQQNSLSLLEFQKILIPNQSAKLTYLSINGQMDINVKNVDAQSFIL